MQVSIFGFSLTMAAVGDIIKVYFKNMASRPYSIHPHGVLYAKEHEGANYGDNLFLNGGRVAPGDMFVYTWEVPERAGPGPSDPSSIVWLYHSHVEESQGDYNQRAYDRHQQWLSGTFGHQW